LVQPYNIFSDCFATMAFGQLYKATGNEEYAAIAKSTFENILKRSENPKGKFNKLVTGTRPLKGFSLPMILCNLSLEIEHLLPAELVEKTIHEVMDIFYQPESGLILENGKAAFTFREVCFRFGKRWKRLNPGIKATCEI